MRTIDMSEFKVNVKYCEPKKKHNCYYLVIMKNDRLFRYIQALNFLVP